MGTSLAKELGLYNEEEIILPIVSGNDTPTGPKYRILRCDPRSATLGINRTPIQVECTPVPKKTISGLARRFDKEADEISQHEEIEDETDGEITEVKSKAEKPVKKYLETDIDAIEQKNHSPEVQNTLFSEDQKEFSPVLSNTWSAEELSKFSPAVQPNKWSPATDMPLPPLKHPRVLTLSTDPRSPASFEVSRSPIQVECSPGMFSLCSRIDSLDISDCESDDPSAIVSEIGESPVTNIPKQPEEFKDWFEGLENKMSNFSAINHSFGSSPKKSPNTFADRNLMKKQLFLTPESNKSPQKQKPRTPLGNVHNNQMTTTSPKNLLRAKQWRGIEEERLRRGVKLDDENTPPTLPPLSHIASAPGKMIRKRNIADWDCDSTMFI